MLEVRHVVAFAPPAVAVLESVRFKLNDFDSQQFTTDAPVELVDLAVQHCHRYPRAAVVLEADRTTWSIELMLSYAMHSLGRRLYAIPMPDEPSRSDALTTYGNRSLREADALRLATATMWSWQRHGTPP